MSPAKDVLGSGMIRFGGLAKPSYYLLRVLHNAFAFGLANAVAELVIEITLFNYLLNRYQILGGGAYP